MHESADASCWRRTGWRFCCHFCRAVCDPKAKCSGARAGGLAHVLAATQAHRAVQLDRPARHGIRARTRDRPMVALVLWLRRPHGGHLAYGPASSPGCLVRLSAHGRANQCADDSDCSVRRRRQIGLSRFVERESGAKLRRIDVTRSDQCQRLANRFSRQLKTCDRGVCRG